MNANEWYTEVKKHTGGMVAFCCDQLAAKDAQIAALAQKVDDYDRRITEQQGALAEQLREIKALEGENAAKDRAIETQAKKIVERQGVIESMQQQIRNQFSMIEDLSKKNADKAKAIARVEAYRDHYATQLRGAGIEPGDPFAGTTYTGRWNVVGGGDVTKWIRDWLDREQRDYIDTLIYGTPRWGNWGKRAQAKLWLDLLYPLHVMKPSATAILGTALHGAIFDETESAAEAEARETESLAHRIETVENRQKYDNRFAGEKLAEHGKRIDTLDAQLRAACRGANEKREVANQRFENIERVALQDRRYATGRLDNQTEKLKELDAAVKHARQSRGKMHNQIDALEKKIGGLTDYTGGHDANIQHLFREYGELKQRVDIHSDIGNKLINATIGEGRDLPNVPLVDQLKVSSERISNLASQVFGEGFDQPEMSLYEMILNAERGLLQVAKRVNAAGIPPVSE